MKSILVFTEEVKHWLIQKWKWLIGSASVLLLLTGGYAYKDGIQDFVTKLNYEIPEVQAPTPVIDMNDTDIPMIVEQEDPPAPVEEKEIPATPTPVLEATPSTIVPCAKLTPVFDREGNLRYHLCEGLPGT